MNTDYINKDSIWFIKDAWEEGDYSVSGYIYCQECDSIEDEQYCCTSCWGYKGDVEDSINCLLDYIRYLEKEAFSNVQNTKI